MLRSSRTAAHILSAPLRFFRRAWGGLKIIMLRPAFRRHGRNFIFDPGGHYTFETIEVGDDVTLGAQNVLMASKSRILIGSKVMFGPGVIILGGDHNTSVVGTFMYDIQSKRPEDDQDVIIEDDVWVGAGVIVLKGVRVCRGSIIAAGSLVYKDVPPYTTVAGVPAITVKRRFDIDTILAHERELYPHELRLERSYLEKIFRLR
jgi:acetyltransferase-like isoleucine patch superfamily enzyme